MPILAITAGHASPTPKEVMQAKYKAYNVCFVKRDEPGILAWIKTNCLAKFSYTSYHKTRYSLDGFKSSVLQDMRNTQKVISSTLTVRSAEQKGNELVVIFASEFKGTVNIDSRRYTLSDQSVSTDTWVKSGKDWKISKRIQVNADMQLQPAD